MAIKKKSHSRRALAASLAKFESTKILSTEVTTWDIYSPPPSNSVKGKLMPSSLTRHRHRRKLSIEVQEQKIHNEQGDETTYEECVLRVLQSTKRISDAFTIKAKHNKEDKHDDHHGTDDDDDDDDGSVVSATVMKDSVGGQEFEGWKPRYRIPISNVTVKKQKGKSVFCSIELGGGQQERELIFDSNNDATGFCDKLKYEQEQEAQRRQDRIKAAFGSIELPAGEASTPNKIDFLIEVVSCWDIPAGDVTGTSDPFVVCMMGNNQIHKTDIIYRTLEPIYTIKTGSLFLLSVNLNDLFLEGGLSFLVEDKDTVGDNEILGVAQVPAKTLYQANGERMEFPLNTQGYLALRCRRASEQDQQFMADYQKSSVAVVAQDHPNTKSSRTTIRLSKTMNGVKMYKTRPAPDPKRLEDTAWMTKEFIDKEKLMPSRQWIESGTGDLGKVHLEILECIDLPNMDVGGMLGNKTDAFAAIVFGDCYVVTDTIDDCLSPCWLPWTKRAFTLHIVHPSAPIYLGLFDFDAGSDHDLIGRVSIDITNLEKDTEYILSYHLYQSAQIEGRKSMGIVKLRLRIEIPNERRYATAGITPYKPCHISVQRKKEFKVVRQTCIGGIDYQKFSYQTFQSYNNELRSYEHVLFYLKDAAATLFLWRGHYRLRLCCSKEIKLPLHSLGAFIVAVYLVENPEKIPSFLFALNAWILLAILGWRNSSPNVWGSATSYRAITQKVLTNTTPNVPRRSIEPFEKWEERKSEMDAYIQRLDESEKRAAIAAKKAAEQMAIIRREEEERLEDLKEMNTSTKIQGNAVDPVAKVLLPFQSALGMFCKCLRFVKHVVIWDESYFSFWLVTANIFLAVSCFFVPWFWVLKWGSRIVVWTIFGPWMKLLDIYGERILAKALAAQEESKAKQKNKSEYREKKESAKKLKEMQRYLFGKFTMEVPLLKLDRYTDFPLPDSSATPYEAKKRSLADQANRIYYPGQSLVGDMIPRRDVRASDLRQSQRRSISNIFKKPVAAKSDEATPLLEAGKTPNSYSSA